MLVDIVKYNILRQALVENAEEEHDLVQVPPRTFPLKKEHSETVLAAAMEILDDKRVMTGITPVDTVHVLAEGHEGPIPNELVLYVLVCYAVALQQGWISYSVLTNKYMLNVHHREAKQYAEDIHKMFAKGLH